MKSLFTTLFLVVLMWGATVPVSAQDSFRAVYDMTGSFEKERSEFFKQLRGQKPPKPYPMVLEIYPDRTFFYNYSRMYKDSVQHAVYTATNDQRQAAAKALEVKSAGIGIYVRSSFETGRRETIHGLLDDLLSYEEEMARPEWKIDESVTEERSGYKCHKATALYLGREWTVWYTPEIPSSAGPWKLWGLPGLIVAAEEAGGKFSFEMTAFGALAPGEGHEDFTKYLRKGEILRESRAKVLKTLEVFTANPMSYFSMKIPNAKISISTPDGRVVTDEELRTKFEYIEL